MVHQSDKMQQVLLRSEVQMEEQEHEGLLVCSTAQPEDRDERPRKAQGHTPGTER